MASYVACFMLVVLIKSMSSISALFKVRFWVRVKVRIKLKLVGVDMFYGIKCSVSLLI